MGNPKSELICEYQDSAAGFLRMQSSSMHDDGSIITVPEDVEMTQGSFVNAQGLKLATYSWALKQQSTPRGIVFLLHGYGAHTQFEYMHPTAPGEPHTKFEGTIVDGCVRAGFVVHSLDHQSHGRSEGVDGLRAYFNKFSDLADEATDYIETVLLAEDRWKELPVFLWSVSMGGATALAMARKRPSAFAGLVLYAPMISLELVRQQEVAFGIKNAHLEVLAGPLSHLLPTVPISKAARNTVHPKSQDEFDNDPLTYKGAVRNRVGEQFLTVSSELLGGGLKDVRTPFVTYHSIRDTFTDPFGSQRLAEMAEVAPEDKTYVRVGTGLDIDADIWHALGCEPGHDKILVHALEWVTSRV